MGEDQRAQLKELILKKNKLNMDKGLPLMNPKLDAGRRAAAIEEMKRAREDCDAEISRLLGAEKYEVFEQFERSLPDRMIMGIFKTKCARTGMALSGEQQERLLEMIAAARGQFPWSTDMGRRLPNPPDPAGMFSAENIAIFASEEEEFDRQVVGGAGRVLTEEQCAAFEPFLVKQRQAKLASVKMTGRMFRPEG